jgi:hypothetical protein
MKAMVGSSGLLAVAATLLGCSGPPPRSVNPTRPLDERRAIELIIAAFRDEHDRPVPGAELALSETKRLHIDVGADQRRYGVAYVSARERAALGSTLVPRDPSLGDALQLVSGLGQDGSARVLVLHDTEYMYDDHVGEAHEASTLSAELRLKRDVRDFLVRAHAEKWP